MGFFLQESVHAATREELNEQVFFLAYGSDGAFSMADVMEMDADQRWWFIEKLSDTLKRQKQKIEEIRAKNRALSARTMK